MSKEIRLTILMIVWAALTVLFSIVGRTDWVPLAAIVVNIYLAASILAEKDGGES